MHKPVSRCLIAKHLSQLITTKSRECVVMAGLQEDRKSHSTLEWLGRNSIVGVPQALRPTITVGFDNTPELEGAG